MLNDILNRPSAFHPYMRPSIPRPFRPAPIQIPQPDPEELDSDRFELQQRDDVDFRLSPTDASPKSQKRDETEKESGFFFPSDNKRPNKRVRIEASLESRKPHSGKDKEDDMMSVASDTSGSGMDEEAEPPQDIHAQLFGPNLKAVHFQQRDIGDCYLIAGLDAIMRHPQADKILRRIAIEEVPSHFDTQRLYRVTFPTGRHVVINSTEVGLTRRDKRPVDGPKGIQLLELAYAKMTRKERNDKLPQPYRHNGRGHSPILVEAGSTKTALQDMLGGHVVELNANDDVPIGKSVTSTDPFSKHPEGLKQVRQLLTRIADDTKHYYLLGAATPDDLPKTEPNYGWIQLQDSPSTVSAQKKFYRDHAYSIRGFDLDKSTITVANPHDTKNKVHTMPLREFCQIFSSIQGIKLKKAWV